MSYRANLVKPKFEVDIIKNGNSYTAKIYAVSDFDRVWVETIIGTSVGSCVERAKLYVTQPHDFIRYELRPIK